MSKISLSISGKRHNGNVHRAAAKINASKSRAARISVCNVLLSRDSDQLGYVGTAIRSMIMCHRFDPSILVKVYRHVAPCHTRIDPRLASFTAVNA